MVTRANLMRVLIGAAKAAHPASSDDTAIRQRLLAALDKELWAPVGAIDIAVSDGVVTLSGVITDERNARRCAWPPRTFRASSGSKTAWRGSCRGPASSASRR